MKLLLDENLPKRLKTDFANHEIYTVRDKGWNGIKNGPLLQLLVENDFHALLTFDKNLQYQQNFQKYTIAVFVLSAINNTYAEVTKLSPIVHLYLNKETLPTGKLSDTECYETKPVGFFGTSIAITANGSEIAKLKMNWRGQILISFKNGQEFMLKGKGLLQDKYVIENEAGEKLFQFDPKFNWCQFNYNYTITNNQQPQNILLALLGVYAANYFIASMSGAVGGIG